MNTNMDFYMTVTGFIGSDAEMRSLPNGKMVASFSVAHTDKWTAANGEKREKTTWVKCTVWGTEKSSKFPEFVNNVAKKGVKVTVVGAPSASAYKGNDGEPRASLELSVTHVNFHTQGNGERGNYSAPEDEGDDLNEIPF